MNQDYSPTELAQAERLENYLAGLEQKRIAPDDASAEDIGLYQLARSFATSSIHPRTLIMPVKPQFNLRKIILLLTPLPLVAAVALVYVVTLPQPSRTAVDVSADLAAIDADLNDLLALEQDLDTSLTEIDLLTSTDYLDQL